MQKSLVAFLLSISSLFSFSVWAHEGHHHPDHHMVFRNDIHAHLYWEKGPVVGGESTLRLEFKNGSDHSAYVADLLPKVVLWMPSMGHGSAPTSVEKAVNANGEVLGYRVSRVYFVMGGDWDLQITVQHLDGSIETQVYSLVLEGGGHGGHHL